MTLLPVKLNHPNETTFHFGEIKKKHTSSKNCLCNGLRISPFHKWINLVTPQLVNAALTAGFIYLGLYTANPWLVATAAVSGVIQAVTLERAWHVSKGYLGPTKPSIYTTVTQISAAYFGNILGGTSSFMKMITGLSTSIITAATLCSLNIEADMAAIRADVVEIGDKI